MDHKALNALGLALFGYGWQSAMARALDVNVRTVQRWSAGDTPVPDWVEPELRRMTGSQEQASPEWPRDEWIVGDGEPNATGVRREYIIHTTYPRFICRAVAMLDEDEAEPIPSEGEVDLLSGITYSTGGDWLCEFVWLDRPPPTDELTHLMERACDALENSV